VPQYNNGMFLASLAQRRCEPEIMDQPDLDPNVHVRALDGLARVNRISASDRILWTPIAALAHAAPGRALRVLDIASGGGDVPIRLWQRARRAGLAIQISGVDCSATAVAHARANAQRAGAAVDFSALDVLRDALPAGFDVLTCSLFLHHLHEGDALGLLDKMRHAAGSLVLVNDLVRSRLGYLAAWLGTRMLSRSHVVHVDGPRSVQAAFTTSEARDLARRAGLAGATVRWRWPWRYLLAWRKPG
jgi:2-polyprenyl-3-methyl-5-hydroxy-6-metoxy-1,4-benzoquinol methylase